MDVITAYREVGTYRGAAEMCGTTHKTVKRIVERDQVVAGRVAWRANYESMRALVAQRLKDTVGRISAKRLLPEVRAAGYAGSDRNFRRLVAQERAKCRQAQAASRGRRPAVWSAGEYLVIDWGVLNGLHVFCAVLAFSRVRFVRFARDERADTTLGLLAECFETLGGVPKVVLADRMGCLKGGVVAERGDPDPGLRPVRHALPVPARLLPRRTTRRVKGIVENLVGYAKTDLMVPLGVLTGRPRRRPGRGNNAAAGWCAEVNGARHSEICAVPTQRLAETELGLLAPLPSLRASIGRRELRKVDKLSCVRFGSARYSVPNRLLGQQVQVVAGAAGVRIVAPATGEVLAEHPLVAPGEVSIIDAHYGSTRPATPARKVTPRTAAEKAFCALGPVAEQFLNGAAAAGHTRLGPELGRARRAASRARARRTDRRTGQSCRVRSLAGRGCPLDPGRRHRGPPGPTRRAGAGHRTASDPVAVTGRLQPRGALRWLGR